jgi:hypothetical protein
MGERVKLEVQSAMKTEVSQELRKLAAGGAKVGEARSGVSKRD